MQRKGITLLLAMLISSTASLLGLGIFMIVYGELGISGSSKASQIAFYAADSGLECSLYYDVIEKTVLATSTYPYSSFPVPFSINCNGSNTTGGYTSIGPNDGTHGGIFKFNFTVMPGSCATVTVLKTSAGQTIIDSFGETVPDCTVSNSRVIQRGLEVVY